MTEATPTDEEVRDTWVDSQLAHLPRDQGIALVPAEQARFDRWLADHDARVKAEALREAAGAMCRESGVTLADALMVQWLNDRADRIGGDTDDA